MSRNCDMLNEALPAAREALIKWDGTLLSFGHETGCGVGVLRGNYDTASFYSTTSDFGGTELQCFDHAVLSVSQL